MIARNGNVEQMWCLNFAASRLQKLEGMLFFMLNLWLNLSWEDWKD